MQVGGACKTQGGKGEAGARLGLGVQRVDTQEGKQRGRVCPDCSPTGPRRDNAENMYYFSELALTLNENEEGVAPTDSRLRPDQRLMEKGHWDEANTEKQRLEEKQRANRRRRLEACSRGCGVDEGEPLGEGPAGEGPAGEPRGRPGAGKGWGLLAAGRGQGVAFRGQRRKQAAHRRPAVPPHREGGRSVCATVVREEAGSAHRGNGLRVQGGLLGGQGEAGLAHVPQHLLSSARPADTGARTPLHLLFRALSLALCGPPTPPFPSGLITLFGALTLEGGSADPGSLKPPGAPGLPPAFTMDSGPLGPPAPVPTTQAGWSRPWAASVTSPPGRNRPLPGSHFRVF